MAATFRTACVVCAVAFAAGCAHNPRRGAPEALDEPALTRFLAAHPELDPALRQALINGRITVGQAERDQETLDRAAEIAQRQAQLGAAPLRWGRQPLPRREIYAAAHPQLAPEIKRAILDGRLAVGMSAEDAVAVAGPPLEIRNFLAPQAAVAEWIYPAGAFLLFRNGQLSSWRPADAPPPESFR